LRQEENMSYLYLHSLEPENLALPLDIKK